MSKYKDIGIHLLVCILVVFAQGSEIEFKANPSTLTPPFSQTLTLRCELANTQQPAVVGKRDVTHTDKDVAYVTSIIVSRGEGDIVASVSKFQSAQGQLDRGQLQVKGDVSGTSRDNAFLEMTWSDPAENQSKPYTCEINAVDNVGHSVVFMTELNVSSRAPTNAELVSLVGQLQKSVAKLQHQLIAQEPHTEAGVGSCCCTFSTWDTWAWTYGPGYERTVTGTFKRPYKEVPAFTVGFSHIDLYKPIPRIRIDILNVTRTGFVVRCRQLTQNDGFRLEFNWMSAVA